MADLLPTIADRTEENKLLEHIRKSHPNKKQPHIIDLSNPSPRDITSSFNKFRDLCVPDNIRTFKSQDYKFYGLLDGTKWLHHVSTCLTKALEAATELNVRECTVVLQEGRLVKINNLRIVEVSSNLEKFKLTYFHLTFSSSIILIN